MTYTYIERAYWNLPREFRKDRGKCQQMVITQYDKRWKEPPHRCPFDAVLHGYCKRHHPVAMAEREAWRLYKEIQKLEEMGFTVKVKSSPPSPTHKS